MTLSRSFVRLDDALGTTPTDARRALAAFTARASASTFGARPGSLWGCVVTGTAGWNYSVAAGGLVTVRSTLEGAYPASFDGATTVATDAAPGSGSRIDIIYAVQHDVDVADADNLAVLGVAIGTASGSPTPPSIPAGALELARNTMTSAATTTASAGNTIVHTSAPITSLHGGFFEVAATADLARIVSPLSGDVAKVVADGSLYVRRSSAWRAIAGDAASEGLTMVTGWSEPEDATVNREHGYAWVSGVVRRDSGSLVTFVGLPAGYRPGVKQRMPAYTQNASGAEGPAAMFEVATNGDMQVVVSTGGPAWTNGTTWFWIPTMRWAIAS